MPNLSAVISQLQSQKTNLEGQLEKINEALRALSGTSKVIRWKSTGRRLSASARARIAAAQRARWAKWKKANKAA